MTTPSLFERHRANPILVPDPSVPWESLVVTNAAVIEEPGTGDVLMLYRAAGHDAEHRIVLGLARSKDGVCFERCSGHPVFEPSESGWDAGCVEDPRLVRFGEWFFLTYASRPFPPGQYWLNDPKKSPFAPDFPDFVPWLFRANATATGLAMTKDWKSWHRLGRLTMPTVDNRDVILFPEKVGGRFVLLQRPMQWTGPSYGTEYPGIWISFSEDLLHWPQMELLAKGEQEWERKIGGNSPPLATDDGWLVFYHGVGPDKLYRLGAMLLDRENPRVVTHRTREPLLEPETSYERDGFYPGVIFPCGQVVRDGKLFLYYGGADRYVALTTCDLDELLAHLRGLPA
jgi:beta-1,2-mannobiose phosphorylase / 1,2-beta-oligomannan phosphorylase